MFNKKIILIIVPILVIGTGYLVWQNYKFYHPKSTGGQVATPPSQEVSEGQAINNLISALPMHSPAFTIYAYDYARGKFLVTSDDPQNLETSFSNWLQQSPFSAIPKSRFIYQQQ